MIDADKLRAFAIPSAVQDVVEADHAFYALSVGMGQDPLDERQLAFVGGAGRVVPMPSVVLVLAHPGFYLADPRSGVDPTMVVHADQSFEILDTIPVEGRVTSSTRLVGLIDKGPGKAAIILAETVLEENGRPFARLNRSTLVRGGGGFGGDSATSTPVPIPASDQAPALFVRQTRPEQALLYRLNGDLNPLHSNPETARAAGFSRPILHGLCTKGIICGLLLEASGYRANEITGIYSRFVAPVFPGEALKVEIWPNGSFKATALERSQAVVSGSVLSLNAGIAFSAQML